ncbi:glycogen-binding subunit 76A [Drosophila mojavensis]|uniref:CBM21 domain-containing protein n=1 Tax=Drosophila mojavensis TaxID=7230 RepID=A0A0Q9XFJ4_DROMO|nr:glycogen-binding subunit 76A [Drosophila mojavensis]XP_032586755.1 glycogen-binding subunit 76A [Drosophila mojavensis]XP_032586756.1 glycogen-binding subunit 76A [Drosophila mojavensis]XP_043865370.1 glycogen-binding subunit 76A [Drosophila mojavensis]KRG06441.1 uncharacterized protein Dmoj_GI13545 [Drosophila mojavensis]
MNEPGDQPLTLSSTPDNRPPCSIISIIPNIGMSSCRGRAEAFARSLSSKLRTLGSQTNEEGVANAEDEPIINGSNTNTWVSAHESEQTVTDLQPLRQESDSFFDFDCELESPGSPADECEYLRLIETASNTPHNSTAESGYACASAASSHSSTDGPYFDAATGATTSSSSNTGTGPQELQPAQTERGKVPGSGAEQQNEYVNTLQLNGSHEAWTNGDQQQQKEGEKQQQKEQQPLEHEQVNKEQEPAQSQSQARESEDETQLQAQILSELQLHSDSIKSPDNGFSEEQVEEPALVNGYVEAPQQQRVEQEQKTTASEVGEEQKTPDSGTDEVDKCSNLTVNVELAQVEQAQQDVEEAEAEKSRHSHGIDTTDDEDDCRPQRVRRCSSLKTGKTPPGTPGRKKIVRFADVLGLDLADVKTFMDEIPTIPKSAFEDLEILDTEPPLQLGPKSDKILMPLFQQPGGLPTFLDAVREKQVSLENAAVTDNINQTIAGTVRVRNLDFHKSVHIRYSLDGWRSFADLQANYVENSCDGFSDKFTFVLFGNSLHVGQRLEFAVRFQCKGQQFWDNNYGANYCFQCLPSSTHTASPASVANGAVPSHHGSNLVGLLSPTVGDAWCSSFY